MSLLGLDIGTSGCKATLIDQKGNSLAQAYEEYSLESDSPGHLEIDPLMVWHLVQQVIMQVVGCENHKKDPVSAIGVSSFGETVIAVDEQGNSLGKSMMYTDKRGQQEADRLRDQLGDSKILSITGTRCQPMFSLCKIMWIKKHQPERYKKTWKFMLFADYILFKLGAQPHTDYSLAARTMAFDISKKKWSQEILDCAGIPLSKFGEPVLSGTVVGQVSSQIQKSLGLPQSAILAAGGHDQPCAALGAGVIQSGMAVDGLGSTECITPAFGQAIFTDRMADNHFACVPHVIKDMYVTYAFTFTSGSILKWYRDNLGQCYRDASAQSGHNVYDYMIEQMPVAPSDLFVLPHFAGAATPYMDAKSQGAIIGLNINTRPEEIVKAILESITFEIMVNSERLEQAGVLIDELIAVGGLAKSQSFLQLKANIMGKKITSLHISEAGTLGVAILAGTACGLFKNPQQGVRALVHKQKTYLPDQNTYEIYQKRFETYKKIYPLLQQLY